MLTHTVEIIACLGVCAFVYAVGLICVSVHVCVRVHECMCTHLCACLSLHLSLCVHLCCVCEIKVNPTCTNENLIQLFN